MSDPGRQLLAFLDESLSDSDPDPDTYLLAAAACAIEDVDLTRDRIEALRLPGQRKLHWRDESPKRRMVIVSEVARLGTQHLIVVRDGRPGEKPERRRRLCLERMLYELDQLPVATATFESAAGPTTAATGTCSTRYAPGGSSGVTYASSTPQDPRTPGPQDPRTPGPQDPRTPGPQDPRTPRPQDPMLWVPDAVCGAVIADRTGHGGHRSPPGHHDRRTMAIRHHLLGPG